VIKHWERDLAEAKKCPAIQLGRIRNNERIAHIPLQSRPTLLNANRDVKYGRPGQNRLNMTILLGCPVMMIEAQ
jgi:hypothetical protein